MNTHAGMKFIPPPEAQQNLLPEQQTNERTAWRKTPPEGVVVPPAHPLNTSDFLNSKSVMKIPVSE